VHWFRQAERDLETQHQMDIGAEPRNLRAGTRHVEDRAPLHRRARPDGAFELCGGDDSHAGKTMSPSVADIFDGA
jgi:hypothetical protein